MAARLRLVCMKHGFRGLGHGLSTDWLRRYLVDPRRTEIPRISCGLRAGTLAYGSCECRVEHVSCEGLACGSFF